MIQRFASLFCVLFLLPGCRFDSHGFDPAGDGGTGNNVNQNGNANTNGNANLNNNNPGNCGDGVVDAAEGCDDGNTESGDGCTYSCRVEHGYDCVGEPSYCSATCGDGVIAHGEQAEACDDGDTVSGDGCAADCTVEPGWACVGEPSNCQETCGDGILDPGEQCDDDNQTSGDGCSDTCQVEHGYDCGTTAPSQCAPVCGDGLIAGGVDAEECDDGDTGSGDGCSEVCVVELGWTCTQDEPSICTEICGDELIVGLEECDCGTDNTVPTGCDGPNSDTEPDACRENCRNPSCGDGVKDTGEACDTVDFGGDVCADHGNFDAGDLGCSGDCQTISTDGCYLSCTQHSECDPGLQCPVDRCEPVGNTCDDSPVIVSGSGTFYGTTENMEDSYNGSSSGGNPLSCGALGATNTAGPDRVYQVTMADGEYLIAWLDPVSWDGTLFLSTACPLAEGSCVAGEQRADDPDADIGSPERLDWLNDSGGAQTVYLVVDGMKAGDWGDYELEITIGSGAVNTFSGGEIIFTEVLPNPAAGGQDQDKCQWFEIYNTSGGVTYNLEGMQFSDAGAQSGTFTIDRPLFILPHEYLIFGTRGSFKDNCGVAPISWVYTGFYVDQNNEVFSMSVDPGPIFVDVASYSTGLGWTITEAYSLYLCTNHLSSSDNDDVANWETTPAAYAYQNPAGDRTNYGTPGEPNPGECNPP